MAFVVLMLRFTVGLIFAVSAISKIRSRTGFLEFEKSVQVLWARCPAAWARPTSISVIGAEALIPAALATGATVNVGFLGSVLLLSIFTFAMWQVLIRDIQAKCNCFGAHSSIIRLRHLARNIILMIGGISGVIIDCSGVSRTGNFPDSALALFIAAMVTLVTVRLDDVIAILRGD